jgi:CRISPR/Cas system CSM-associated protein Csm3 (group 7 of RAMP superfamily)
MVKTIVKEIQEKDTYSSFLEEKINNTINELYGF